MNASPQGTPAAGSAQSARKRPEPPSACTTADQVRIHALWAAMEVRAIADDELPRLAAIMARSADPVAQDHVRHLARLASARLSQCEAAAAFLDECVTTLENAEAKRDWYGLVDLTLFPGKEAAAFLKDLVDPIRLMRLGEIPEARRKLDLWFASFAAAGKDIFEQRIAYELGAKRGKVLRAEFERWQQFGEAT